MRSIGRLRFGLGAALPGSSEGPASQASSIRKQGPSDTTTEYKPLNMSDIGPALPPHLLAKRKRQQEEEANNATTTTSGAKRSPSPEDGGKRRKVIGPAMPPAPLEERPAEPANPPQESDSEDDDDFGPALPPTGDDDDEAQARIDEREATAAREREQASRAAKPKRDDWMTMPPQQDDLASRMDPTRQRPRGFNTGKGARAGHAPSADHSTWHETAEQKQKRLADEMMGVSHPPAAAGGARDPQRSSAKAQKDEAAAQKIRAHAEETRGPSLLEQHKRAKGADAEEDDPSQRAFDREKDMNSGIGSIGGAQKQEMLKKAAGGFSSKFAGGSYL